MSENGFVEAYMAWQCEMQKNGSFPVIEGDWGLDSYGDAPPPHRPSLYARHPFLHGVACGFVLALVAWIVR